MTSVTKDTSDRMKDMDTAYRDTTIAAKMQKYTSSDPEADAVIQQADERVGKPGPIIALTLYKLAEIFFRCAFRRHRLQQQGTRHTRSSVTEAG